MRKFRDYCEAADKNRKDNSGEPFGYLAGYDIYNANGPLMFNSKESKKEIQKFLVQLVKKLTMEVASDPICYMSDEKEIKTMQHVGASAFIALEDSGIMLHTITNRNPKFACIDVFSCKKFDPNIVTSFLKEVFQTEDLVLKFIKRGTRYNENNK